MRAPFSAAVSVTSVGTSPMGTPCGGGLATGLGLRASDGREWTYFVYLPGRPADQVQVGDELDLSVQATGSMFFDQSVVLGQGTSLVLFSKVSWLSTVPNLDTYGITLGYDAPSCTSLKFQCPGKQTPLVVTRGSNSSRIAVGATGQAGDLSVSVNETFTLERSGSCSNIDPPDTFQYGGFRPRQ